MKRILGLDLGTNSIGWALIQHDYKNKIGEINGLGSRIIPMSQDILGKFDSGQSISQTAERTSYRGTRRLYQRDNLRRERLHRVLNILGFLPYHYSKEISFDKNFGQFKEDKEPKIAYRKTNSGNFEFIFKSSFEEMVADFKETNPHLFYKKPNGKETKIPYDWTIYYLRKKSLYEPILKEELAWLLLNFNQKRGYYQLRGDEELEANQDKSFEVLKVDKLVNSGSKIDGKDLILYDVYFDNGWKYDRQVVKTEDWSGRVKEFIVTKKTLATGEVKRSFKAVNSEEDWVAIKQKTEQDLENSKKTVGAYIYDTLLKNPNQKIRGKLIRTIERKFYKAELQQILKKQQEFHPELQDRSLYINCTEELYKHNKAHRKNISERDFSYLFIDDIIFYQRPLKSQKHLISNCTLEFREFKNREGNLVKGGIKCIAKSSTLYQEFRLLQWLRNIKIFKKNDIYDIDITRDLLSKTEDWEQLFEWLNDKTDIDQKAFLRYPKFKLEEKIKENLDFEEYKIYKKDKSKGVETYYRWNYVEDKKYPLNETRGGILKKLKSAKIDSTFLTPDAEEHLWHILYSVEDSLEIESALCKFAQRHNLSCDFVDAFKKYPRIKKDYGAFSAKALKRLLPLMRFGKWWNFSEIDSETKETIDKIITGEYDKKIKNRVREKAILLKEEADFQNLPLWLASYVVYGRHSEVSDLKRWRSSRDIELLKQHSLRNPIVEQVVNETLQIVKDVWDYFGEGKENFFDEIHVELGREMKNTAEKRKRMSETVRKNENTNIRIKSLLAEMLNDGNVENVRPYSPTQQEILKIYEEGVYNNESNEKTLDEIDTIRRKIQPSAGEIKRYKLWLEQGYISPYTGEVIPISELFTSNYEVEHIIPQSRYFDDGLSNKVICEAEVNSLKGNQLAFEFIKNNPSLKVELGYGKIVELLSVSAYQENVKKYFGGNRLRAKREKLLLEDIPEKFIERQLNDTRYISKVVKSLLSNIVRDENEEEATSKNLLVASGGVTTRLKNDWGLNAVWNELITPRFERLNKMAGYNKYGSWEDKRGKQVFQINNIEPELLKLNKKRIDHRHHSVDALIVACCSRDHVNYLNNQSASKDKKSERFDLRKKLRNIEIYIDVNGKQRQVAKDFLKPWDTFTQDAKEELSKVIVSFKKNVRVINKTVNKYYRWEKQKDGSMKKTLVKQTKGDSWAIRKPLHKETVSGLVNIRRKRPIPLSTALNNTDNIFDKSLRNKIKALKNEGLENKKIMQFFKAKKYIWGKEDISRVEVFYYTNDSEGTKVTASRVALDDSFNEKKIESITDKSIQRILFAHLESYKNLYFDEKGKPIPPEKNAFAPAGINVLNKNIIVLNRGKQHAPIYKVRVFEKLGEKFVVGITGNNVNKYVEAAKGTNLFFAIYVDDKDNRAYETIPLNIVIERQKQGLTSSPERNEKGSRLLFDLSPNDLVYVPTEEEQDNPHIVEFQNLSKEQVRRVYRFVSCTKYVGYFTPSCNASEIVDNENGTNSKSERIQDFFDGQATYDDKGNPVQIKSVCWKLIMDRLGNVKKVIR